MNNFIWLNQYLPTKNEFTLIYKIQKWIKFFVAYTSQSTPKKKYNFSSSISVSIAIFARCDNNKKIWHMSTGLFCVSLCNYHVRGNNNNVNKNFCEKVSRIDALFVHHSSSTSVATWRNLIVIYIGWFFCVSECMCVSVCVWLL